MKLINKQMLQHFKEKYVDSKSHIESWEAEIEEAQWNNPHELKARYHKASFLGNLRVVFNICWNKYRLLTIINYKNKIVFVEKIGTHKEYDKWDLN